MNRRTMMAGSITAVASLALPASAETRRGAKVPARNVVLMHGLFADGSCMTPPFEQLFPSPAVSLDGAP